MEAPAGTVGAFAAILDELGRLLIVQENDGRRRFGFPGGRIEDGERPEEAVVRECLEETGLTVRIEHLVGSYGFTNGLQAMVFRCSVVSGSPGIQDDEIAYVGWLAPDQIPPPIRNSLHFALADALAERRSVARADLTPIT